MFSKAFYFLIQCLLTLVSPILSLAMSLKFYKSAISQLFFVVFAFYFGYFCHFFFDESYHYKEFMNYYVGFSFSEIMQNPLVFVHGHDYFHVLVKFIVSRFTESHNVFGGVFCAIHAGFLVFFLRQLKQFYLTKTTKTSVLILITVCVVFEFYWYSTLRFNTATFFFAAFYLKWVMHKNPLYLVLAAMAPLFHYSFLAVDGAIMLELSFRYVFKHKYFRYAFLGLSLFIRSLNIDFVPLLLRHIEWMRKNMSYAIINENTRANVLSVQQTLRESGNWVYNFRPYLLLILGLGSLWLFRHWGLPKDTRYIGIFYMFLTLFSVANFGYGDMFFYDRMFQVSLLLLWAYVFIMSVKYYSMSNRGNLLLFCILLLPTIFFVITPFVQFRNSVLNPELIFGNFFMDWDGNDYEVGYSVHKFKNI